jgi:heavy metal sensor kinase
MKQRGNVFSTLTGRLTIIYTALTGLLAVLMVLFIYIVLIDTLESQYDEIMKLYAKDIEAIYRTESLDAVRETLQHAEQDDPDSSDGFIRFITGDKRVIASSDLTTWPDLPVEAHPFHRLKTRKSFTEITTYEHRKKPIRMLYWKIDDTLIMQLGLQYEDDSYVINQFTITFGVVVLIVILLSAVIGYFMANRAMSGVKQVTSIASRISAGKLTARVQVANQPEEIEQLATSFNIMIDRIESLIGELKEVSNAVAHDLRSPLTRIRGNAEVVLRGNSGIEDYHTMAQRVVEDCEKLESMINTMLEIASLDSGVTVLRKERLDLKAVLVAAEEIFSEVAEDSEQHLEVSLPKEPVYLQGDRSKLQRAIANLLDNALKYTPRAGTISLHLAQNDKQVELGIKDTGPGIAKENHLKVFDPFFREDASRTKPGNGLGLSYVKTIVEKHQGRISVSTPEEGGTLFVVTFEQD